MILKKNVMQPLKPKKICLFAYFLIPQLPFFDYSVQEKIFSKKNGNGKIFINTATRMFHNTIATERSRDENE